MEFASLSVLPTPTAFRPDSALAEKLSPHRVWPQPVAMCRVVCVILASRSSVTVVNQSVPPMHPGQVTPVAATKDSFCTIPCATQIPIVVPVKHQLCRRMPSNSHAKMPILLRMVQPPVHHEQSVCAKMDTDSISTSKSVFPLTNVNVDTMESQSSLDRASSIRHVPSVSLVTASNWLQF